MIKKREPNVELGYRLRQLREQHNMSIYDVEKAIGVHFSTVSKYELNKRQPSLDVLKELASLYQVSLSELIGEKTEGQDNYLSQELISAIAERNDLQTLLDLARECDPETVTLLSRLLEKILQE